MTAVATIDEADLVAAPAPMRPVRLREVRPWDRIAFRPPSSTFEREVDGAAETAESGPPLRWPRPVPTDLPDPTAWCGTLVRTFVEVLLGSRPPAQLTRWLTADLYASLARRATICHSAPPDARRVRVLRVHTCRLDETRYEASVVLHDGRRVRAAAIRIEVFRQRWRATALEIG